MDEVTWEEYGEHLDARLLDLQDRIHRGSYHPQPVRRVHIPKGDGRVRPLGIPALEDKLVQQAARMVLEPIYERAFLGFSYGFRPGWGPHNALNALAEAIGRKTSWVLDADIRSFYDTIDHGWMQKFFEHRIGDRRMVRLLMKWFDERFPLPPPRIHHPWPALPRASPLTRGGSPVREIRSPGSVRGAAQTDRK